MLESTPLEKLYLLAAASPHKEICGILASDYQILPVTNVANAGNQFVMHKAEYFRALNKLKAEGLTVFAIYHSHPNGNCDPSAADMEASRRTGHNYLIVTSNKRYSWVDL